MGGEQPYKEELKVRLYDDDLKRLGKTLAEENESLNTLEARKSEIASSLAAQIKAHKANISEISAKINRGYELREVECSWLMEVRARPEDFNPPGHWRRGSDRSHDASRHAARHRFETGAG